MYHNINMIKSLIAVLSLSFASVSFGQAVEPTWNLKEVMDKDKSIVGYVYSTSAIGTTSNQKSITNLRLICSLKDSPPIIAIYWKDAVGNGDRYVTAEVDGRTIGYGPRKWERDGNLTYRNLNESTLLLQSLRTGRQVKFTWESISGPKRTTMFTLNGFNTNYSKFISDCKIQPQ